MVIRRIFAKNLRKARALRKISQEGLALEAGIERTYVGLLEREKSSPTIDMVAKLARVLKMRPDELLRDRRKPPRRS